jgi:hypothetical protein
MKQEFTPQYLEHIQEINECTENGRLISLLKIYDDYGRPKYKSPKRVLCSRTSNGLIEYEIEKSGYQVEKVIQFTKDDVLVCEGIALSYLNHIDVKNYVIAISQITDAFGIDNLMNRFFKL